ncbi:conjugal transfer protein TrbF [Niveispirillum cyanobacteriorum]|uniref:Conjugal transfer protein TrbF n=1 Tax=Niveispirillum cyanobacteriorum TaxID=1612173 RepID=A0A2K9NI03_9PROT|nr:conjugal transfer protein TrbF [Niveispirillum cyanobacteriorum]AUN32709.1 conjugal transfer protein TrbF [Niveispirillum cyanobacteriorum]GGE83474.1 conjugal transfer protein TrbF [Niveispirillum cyanobacteriorum]
MFKRTLQRYGTTPDPVTPHQKAAQLWDERIGSVRVQARNWRLMAFGCLGLAVGLAGIVAWQSGQSRIIPYVVEIDRLGEARAVAPATSAYQPTDTQVAYYLGRFISNVRSLSTDPVLVRQNWLSAYDFVADRAALFLNEQAKLTDPFSRIGTNSVTVQVTSIVRASDQSFQVKWTEQHFERGSLVRTDRWISILAVSLRPPSTPEALARNPLGVTITAIDWSREFDTQPTPRNTP